MRKQFVSIAVALFLVGTAHNASAALFTYSGDTTLAPTFDRPFCGGSAIPPPGCALSVAGTAVRYSVFAFTVDLSAYYTIANVAGTNTDPVFVLYRDSFAPGSPLVNIYAFNDDADASTFRPGFTEAPLLAGTQYFLVTTGFISSDFGTFTNEFRWGYGNAPDESGNVIPTTVPEPASLTLLGSALAGVLLRRARASRRQP